MLSGNLQCLKALLQYCGNRSLLQCCGNALRHCGLLQCAQRIAAMAPLRQYCSNEVLQQYCGNAAAIAMLQQHCGNAHCKVLLQYCGNRGHCGNAFWYCRNTPIFSRFYEFLGVQLFPGYRPMGLSRIQACTEIYTWRGQYELSENRASI